MSEVLRIPNLVIVSGPSGCGKGSMIAGAQEVLGAVGKNLTLSVSSTTRPPREGEVGGVDYDFISPKEFDKRVSGEYFAEWSEHCGNRYGSPTVEQVLGSTNEQTCAAVWDVEHSGAVKLIKGNPEQHFTWVAVLPPSHSDLELRLRCRGTEDEAKIQQRLKRWREEELLVLTRQAPNQETFPNLTVVNNDLARATTGLAAVCMGWALHGDPIPKEFIIGQAL